MSIPIFLNFSAKQCVGIQTKVKFWRSKDVQIFFFAYFEELSGSGRVCGEPERPEKREQDEHLCHEPLQL